MSIQTQWLDESHTTIYQKFEQAWTSSEYDSQFQQIERWVQSAEHDVSLIVELDNIDQSAAMETIKHEDFPRKLNHVIIVHHDGTVTRALLSIINRVTPPTKKSPIVIVRDIDEAYEVLHLSDGSVA